MKKTNTFKRFAAITSASILAACMVAPMAMTSNAAEVISSGTITINTSEGDHAYRAYQIFDGDLSKDGDKITFANVEWGSGVNETIPNPAYVDAETTPGEPETLSIYDELMKVNSAFSDNGAALTEAEAVSKALQTINGNIPGVATYAEIDKIAAVFAKFKKTSGTPIINKAYDSGKYVIDISDPGYYLVEETTSGDNLEEGEAVTKYLLQVAGAAVVSPKADAPKVMKKVYEDSKTTADEVIFNSATNPYRLEEGYNDVADYSIGENIEFTLYGTLPTSFANYTGYYYQFTDTMGAGLDLVDINADDSIDANDFTVTIKDGDKTVTLAKDNVAYKIIKTEDDDNTDTVNEKGFKVIIPDLKTIDMDSSEVGTQNMSSSAIITVDYTAKLNANAVIGNPGNPNDVYLTYSNNSNTAQGGLNNTNDGPKDETGDTEKDYNVVFTYELDVTKYLGDKKTTADDVVGTMAGFKLKNGTNFAKLEKDATSGKYKFVAWTTETDATEVFTNENGIIEISGIQDGTYTLTETTVPTGYNKMDDKTIVIAADTSNASTGNCQNYNETSGTAVGNALTSLTISVDGDTPTETTDTNKGKVAMDVINNKGNELPETGGIGTTLFYLGGGAMVAVAGVYLISKKRMKNAE